MMTIFPCPQISFQTKPVKFEKEVGESIALYFLTAVIVFLASSALVKNVPIYSITTLLITSLVCLWYEDNLEPGKIFIQFKHVKSCQAIKTVRQMSIFQCLPLK